jgi:hypothetical protein
VPAVDFLDFAELLSANDMIAAVTKAKADRVRRAARAAIEAISKANLVLANEPAAGNLHMRGLLVLAPGTGEQVIEILKRTTPDAEKLIMRLAEYAEVEKAYIAGLHPGYPSAWKKTRWPKVIATISKGLHRALAAPAPGPTDAPNDWCTLCEDVSRNLKSAVSSSGVPV